MKLLFIRHGESTDDIDDQYGGWADFDLTDKGKRQLAESAKEIKKLGLKFERIVHSPLKRAAQSAKILAEEFNLELQESIWLKERNKYGLLSGITKEKATKDFPELVQMLEDGYVHGAEPVDMFEERVSTAYDKICSNQQQVIIVTHGGFLNSLVENRLSGAHYIKAGDGGFILVDTDDNLIVRSFNFELARI